MTKTKMNAIDLHAHSDKSDGSLTPTQLVELALAKNLKALALTDHDTTLGIEEALKASEGTDLEVIPGVEFSTNYNGQEVHIVGLYINQNSEAFQDYLSDFQASRINRNKKMCLKLQEYGINVRYDELIQEFPDCTLTRAHYARFIYKLGYTKSIPEAFERFIGNHGPCYVEREKITPNDAIKIIHKAGGVAVLAHPILYHLSDANLDKLVSMLKDEGLDAIEAIYSTYSPSEERQVRALANKYDLLLSGGSDFHGAAKPKLDLGTGYGKLFVPYELLEKIKECKNQKPKKEPI